MSPGSHIRRALPQRRAWGPRGEAQMSDESHAARKMLFRHWFPRLNLWRCDNACFRIHLGGHILANAGGFDAITKLPYKKSAQSRETSSIFKKTTHERDVRCQPRKLAREKENQTNKTQFNKFKRSGGAVELQPSSAPEMLVTLFVDEVARSAGTNISRVQAVAFSICTLAVRT